MGRGATELNADAGTVRFSTDSLAERERLPTWREFYARKLLRLDWEPSSDLPFKAQVSVQTLPGLGVYTTVCSPFRARLTREFLDGGRDSIFLVLPASRYVVAQAGREVELASGEATAMSNRDPALVASMSAADRRLGLYVPRARLAPLVRDIDAAMVRRIPAGAEPLRLLKGYVAMLQRGRLALATPELQHVAVSHVYDLVAAALGATRDAADAAAGRGLAAARLVAIKADILKNLSDSALSLTTLGKRHCVTPRYIRAMFEREGTNFSDYIREQRLARAFRLLTSAGRAHLLISTIAYEAGFGDVSNFNRAFRRLYGASPSQLRNGAAADR